MSATDQKQSPEFQTAVNDLARQSIQDGPVAETARTDLRDLLQFDDLNLAYFLALYQAKKNPKKGAALEIFEEGRTGNDRLTAYPTAIATPELLRHLPYVDYASLCASQKNYKAAARKAALWLKKMQAGTGSSMTRTSYKARMLGIPEERVRIGAKGTDLFVEVPDPKNPARKATVSLVEAQLLQSIFDARQGTFGCVILHDIISSETQASMREIWNKPSLSDDRQTYTELVAGMKGISRFGESFQSYLPTLNEKLEITFNREAPGGHALFALDSLRAAFIRDLQPQAEGLTLISSVGNGEDLSSTPDDVMVGWMVEERVPIAMITTEKTPNDLKGGQIALVQDSYKQVYATIIEKAQAEESNQLKLFEELGLSVKRDGQIAFFNTNMVLYNYEVLSPIVEKIIAEVGDREFMRIIAPDLVDNWKEQKDADGQRRRYLQLEGATASTLLNLDRWYRGRYNRPLVHFINVDKNNRTKFFSPIKSAFDFFMQFHSDLFSMDPRTMRLIHRRPGVLPAVTLKHAPTKDKFYQDVQNVLDSFGGASIAALDSLTVDGLVDARDVRFEGRVEVVNKSERKAVLATAQELPRRNGRVVLDRSRVTFPATETGRAALEKLV